MKRLIMTCLFIALLSSIYAQSEIEEMLTLEGYYQHFNGNALIQTDSQYYQGSFGSADFSANLLNDPMIPSDIGSISKQFTAAAILHLVHQGKVSLTEPINTYLCDYASKRWKKVTVHHLLTHTSGIPSLFQHDKGMEKIWPSEDVVSLDTLISLFRDKKLLFKPGKKYRYSNSGYVLLATIVEQVTNRTYESFMEKELFEQYGLAHTSFGTPENSVFARPYYGYRVDLVKQAPIYHKCWMIGAGGIYSTVSDLSRWIDIITSDSFLTKELKEAYFGKHISKRGGYYGYGWETMKKYGVVQHDGTNFGYVSYLGFNPDTGDRIIFLTNQTYESIEQLGNSSSFLMDLQNDIWEKIYGDQSLNILPTPETTLFSTGVYSLNDSVSFLIEKADSVYHISQLGALPITGIAQAYPIQGGTENEQRLIRISGHLLKKKFRKLKPDCDKQMKLATRLGIISLGYNMITSDLGTISEASPFYLNKKYGLIRLKGNQGLMDLIIYFDEEGLMQGIFEHGRVSVNSSGQWVAFPVEGDELFIDGFPYGEDSVYLSTDGQRVTLRHYNRVFDIKTDGID